MRVQKLALAVGLVSALGGNAALALGLGEIKLNSTLNQPLNAEIKLLQTRGLGEGEIKVRLANAEDFERAGVDRAYSLGELRFDVDYSSGQPVVRISSRTPMREPFLNFLVETRWPSGRLLREYTLLMDLPAFSTNTASQPVQAAERERQQVRRETPVQKPLQPSIQRESQRAPEPVQAPVEQPAPVAESAPENVPSGAQQPEQPVYEAPAEEPMELQPETVADSGSRVYGPVEANNTLWEIARDSRETRELSVQQTMLAIQRLNPEAFINNNINLLKKGAVLRLPTAEEVRNVTQNEAVTQVATQNDAWRERVSGTDSEVTGAPLDGRAVVEETAESDALEGRVSLAAPGDNESVLSGAGSGSSESEALEGELAVSEEELDKSRLENTELQERIGELDEQIDTMERLVEVSNEEMQAVQTAAEQSGEIDDGELAGELDSEELTSDELTSEESGAEELTQAGTETVDSEPVVAAERESAEAEDDDARNRVVVQAAPEPTLVERLMDNIQLIGIGAGVLLFGLVGFFTWRRRKEEEEAIRQVEAEMAAESTLTEEPEPVFEDDNLAAVEELEASDGFDLDQLGELETDDPVGEAEIHLSLGQYQEAEAKLQAGLAATPGNVDARLMLLEVYAHQQSAEQFDDHYRQLLGYSDGPAADRAARLRETITGIGPFEAPETGFSSESLEAAQLDDMGADFDIEASFDDLDEFSNSNTGSGVSATAANPEEGDDFGLLDDLSLDLDDDTTQLTQRQETQEPVAEVSSEESDFSLELDLGDDFDNKLGGELNSELEGSSELASDDGFTFEALDESFGESAKDSSGESELSLDLELDSQWDSGTAAEPIANEEAQLASESDSFDLDDLVADGELDLDSLEDLDLESDFEVTAEQPAESAAAVDEVAEDGGLAFDLDLTPMDDGAEQLDDAGASAQAVENKNSDLDLEDDFGDDLGSLDLDSIDLGDLDLEGDDLSLVDNTADASAGSSSSRFEQGEDLAVAEEQPAAKASPAQAAAKPAEESELGDLGFNLESDLDSELNLLEGSDEVSTKLELAQAYLDMGDKDGAREILGEVVEEAAGEHQQRAKDMLERMS